MIRLARGHAVRRLVLPLALAAGAPAATAQLGPRGIEPLPEPLAIGVSWQLDGADAHLRVDVARAAGSKLFHVFAGPPHALRDPAGLAWLGSAPLDAEGRGVLELFRPGFAALPAGTQLAFTVLTAGGRRAPGTSSVVVSTSPPCEPIDFDAHPDPNFDLPVAGTPISQQWSVYGLELSAANNVPGHPDLVIGFDSANPTPPDPDLATPGYGPNNTVAWGTLLIIPENDLDADNDGVIDVPNDEGLGGTMHLDFDAPARLCSITLVDIDDANGTRLDFFAGNTLLTTIGVPNAGDNSVQTLFFDVAGVTRLDVVLGGSGGVAEVGAALCPTIVDFDELTTGVQLGLPAGTELTNQLAPQGITVSATNFGFGPDKAILFDTAAPTGEDTDLAVPGYGPGNADPAAPGRGMVLVVAEDDVDADSDGLVDDPDDAGLGGTLAMDFLEPVVFESASVLDVDTYEMAWFALTDSQSQVTILPLASLGDNSLQSVAPPGGVTDVVRVELHLSGSGAWVDLVYCPTGTGGGQP